MNEETKELLNRLLKESSATNSFLNDDHLNSLPGDKSTRQMVIDMIAEGLDATDWKLVLRAKV